MLDRLTIERMRAIADGGPIAVALSGGGDSVSLMHLLAAEFGPRRLLALVVDHALRVGSSADAEKARQGAIQLGLEAEILTLDWRGAPSGAQQAARHARYRALCEAARRAAAPVIALGHTADDQAETVFMRAAAGSGWRGLAGMAAIAPSPVWPQGRGVAIARPLLGARRAALRDYLQTRAAQWLEDPANANPAFERVRVRQRLAALEAAGLDALRFARLADRLRPHVAAVDAAAADIIARAVRFEGSRIALDRTEWAGDRQARQRALALLLSAASGAARGPAPAALERLENRIANADFRGGSLAGARLSLKGGNILIDRDPGALIGRSGGPERAAPMDLPPGEVQVWDGRAALCVREPGWRVEPGKDGQPAFAHLDRAPESAPIEVEWLVEARVRHGLAFR